MEFTDGNFWSSKINGWEKPAQSARLVIQFGYLDTVGDGVEMCKFTEKRSLPCKYGRTDQSGWTASTGLKKGKIQGRRGS
jgi:hypothetical protein